MNKTITPNYVTDKTKMIKTGDIYIQRTKNQSLYISMGQPSAKKERYWVVEEIKHDPNRTILKCEGEGIPRLILRGHATDKFFLSPKKRNKLYSRVLESKECFNFPLKNFKNAKPWMIRFHRKLGFKVPDDDIKEVIDQIITSVGDDPILARALQPVMKTPPKRKREPECPPAPKKRKVGRFTVTERILIDTKCV